MRVFFYEFCEVFKHKFCMEHPPPPQAAATASSVTEFIQKT